MSVHGVGIDVAQPGRIASLAARRGDGFLTRWFTAGEIGQYADSAGLDACFAAKEAVWKSLRLPGGGPVPWALISIHEDAGGHRVELSGWVAAAADQAGVGAVRVSVCPADGLLAAIAMAETTSALEREEHEGVE